MKLKMTIAALLFCGATNLFAQTSGEHCVAFKAQIDNSIGVELTEQQEGALTSKLNQILTRNNAATTSLYSGFALTPQISIYSEEAITSGIRPVTTLNAEITLLTSNIVDDSNYGSITLEVKGTGNSKEQAITNIISTIRPADPRIVKFMKSAINRITDYYSMNMPTIIRKTETLMAGNRYEDAMIFLESIPTCVPAYEQSSDAIQALYKVVAEKSCDIAINMANRYIVIEDYEMAKEILLSVDADSKCNKEVNSMLTKVQKLINEAREEETEELPAPAPKQEQAESPTVAPAAAPAPAPAAAKVDLSNPFNTFDIQVQSCTGDAATNVVTIEILVKNVTDLAQEFKAYSNKTLMYNNSGDEFSVKDINNNNLSLRSGMSRKFSISFNRVPTKNSSVNVTINCYDSEAKTSGIIDIKDMPVAW